MYQQASMQSKWIGNRLHSTQSILHTLTHRWHGEWSLGLHPAPRCHLDVGGWFGMGFSANESDSESGVEMESYSSWPHSYNCHVAFKCVCVR